MRGKMAESKEVDGDFWKGSGGGETMVLYIWIDTQ